MFDVKTVTSPKPLDCGPCCLQMLLDYYGQEVELDQLIQECNTRYVGCTATDLVRVGTAHGLDMRAYQEDAASLIKQDRPAIVWWLFDHFCVFCGVNEAGKVVVINPDMGKYSMTPDTFASFYTGVALTNGEPEDLPEPEPDEDSELAQAARILLGVEE